MIAGQISARGKSECDARSFGRSGMLQSLLELDQDWLYFCKCGGVSLRQIRSDLIPGCQGVPKQVRNPSNVSPWSTAPRCAGPRPGRLTGPRAKAYGIGICSV